MPPLSFKAQTIGPSLKKNSKNLLDFQPVCNTKIMFTYLNFEFGNKMILFKIVAHKVQNVNGLKERHFFFFLFEWIVIQMCHNVLDGMQQKSRSIRNTVTV